MLKKIGGGSVSDKVFLSLGFLCALTVFLDMPIGMLAMTLAGISPSDSPTGWTMVIVLCPIIIIWAFLSRCIYYRSKNKYQFDIFQYKDKPSVVSMLIVFGILICSIIMAYYNWEQQFRALGEYHMIAQQVGEMAWFVFILQYVYYLFEMTFVSLCIVYIQEFVSRKFSIHKIPFGGLAAGLLWGFLLHVRQGIVPGLQGLLAGVLFGCIYILMRKNIRYAFPFIYLSFIL